MLRSGRDAKEPSASAAFEIAAAEMAFGFQVADHGLDGGSASQFALDGAEHAALLARDEDAARILRIVAAVSLVDIAPLDLAAGEFLGLVDDGPQGVPSRTGMRLPHLLTFDEPNRIRKAGDQ